MSRLPRDRSPHDGAPIRLGVRDEVRPLRLEAALRVEPAAVPSAAGRPAAAPASAPAVGAPPVAAPGSAPDLGVALAAKDAAEPGAVAETGARWDGAGLRAAREAAGISIARLAERTKLSRTTLESIEAQRVARLPDAYLKGFVSTIARELGLDAREVTRSYLDAVHPPPPEGEGSGPIR